MAKKRGQMIDKGIALNASNVIYSTFLAIMCSNVYVATQGKPFEFYNPMIDLPLPNLAFLLCVVLYLVLNWLTDTVYHASPGIISDLYLIGSLFRISLFGFCFYESFNSGVTKYYLFFSAGMLEIFLEYFAYLTCIKPIIIQAEKNSEAKLTEFGAEQFTKFGFAAAKVVPPFIFLIRFLTLIGVLFFSVGLLGNISSPQQDQTIAVAVCVFFFTCMKIVSWLIIREQDLTSLFKHEGALA